MSSNSTKATALARLIRRELLTLEGISKINPCRRFHHLFSVGEPADRLYYLDSGLVKVFRAGLDGRQVILKLVFAGELLGEQALLANTRRTTSAEVMETGAVYAIPRSVFLQFAERHPEMWTLFAEVLLGHERLLLEKIEMITMRSVEERILFYLDQLADVCGTPEPDGTHILVRMSQSELAGWIGATRETTSSTLNLLQRRGLIQLRRRQIVVPRRVRQFVSATDTPAAVASASASASASAPETPAAASQPVQASAAEV